MLRCGVRARCFLWLLLPLVACGAAVSSSKKPAEPGPGGGQGRRKAPTCKHSSDGIDVSGVSAFADVASQLRSDVEPSTRQWAAMDNSSGYRVLFEREFDRDEFRETLRVALMPSRLDTPRAKAELSRYMSHYAGWAANNLTNFPALLDTFGANFSPCRSVELTLPYLPIEPGRSVPPVAVNIFAPDARGYDPIVFDLSLVEQYSKEQFQLLAAHEFHHYFRQELLIGSTYTPNAAEAAVLWGLDQLQAEGVADLINVPSMLESSFDDPVLKANQDRYLRFLATAGDSIQAFDRCLDLAAKEGPAAQRLRGRVRDALPMSAHPTGFFMARLIERQLGRQRLVRHVADPFAFIDDYHEAAQQLALRGEPSPAQLGPRSRRYLHTLRLRVSRSPTSRDRN